MWYLTVVYFEWIFIVYKNTGIWSTSILVYGVDYFLHPIEMYVSGGAGTVLLYYHFTGYYTVSNFLFVLTSIVKELIMDVKWMLLQMEI